jgi:hypothetical protein
MQNSILGEPTHKAVYLNKIGEYSVTVSGFGKKMSEP